MFVVLVARVTMATIENARANFTIVHLFFLDFMHYLLKLKT